MSNVHRFPSGNIADAAEFSVDNDRRGASGCFRRIPANVRRKPQFQIATEFWQEDGEKRVVKRSGPESRAFLLNTLICEQRARDFFGGEAQVVSAKLVDSVLVYEYMPHPSLHELVGERLESGDENAGADLIAGYSAFVSSLPTETCVPSGFMQEYRIPPTSVDGAVKCLRAGAIDLIPSNILVSPEIWHVCDHEFFFEWQVPVDLVIYRGVATLVNRLQSQIRAQKRTWTAIPFSGCGRRRVFIPVPWISVFAETKLPLRMLAKWSWHFERSILKRSSMSYLSRAFLRAARQNEGISATAVEWLAWVARQLVFKVKLGLDRLH
jgi:hypothetical protein